MKTGTTEDESAGEAAEDEGALDEAQEPLQAEPAFFKGPEPFASGMDGPGGQSKEGEGRDGEPPDSVCGKGQNADGAPCGEPEAEKANEQADEPGDCSGAVVDHGGQ